jgi:hypothetical protein
MSDMFGTVYETAARLVPYFLVLSFLGLCVVVVVKKLWHYHCEVVAWKAQNTNSGSIADQAAQRQFRRTRPNAQGQQISSQAASAPPIILSTESFSQPLPQRLSAIDEDWEAQQAQIRISQQLAD